MCFQSKEELCWCSLKRGSHQRRLRASLTKILHYWSSSHYFTLGERGELKYFLPAGVDRPLRSSRCPFSCRHWGSVSRGAAILPESIIFKRTSSLVIGSTRIERR